jgi:hypothetical protein
MRFGYDVLDLFPCARLWPSFDDHIIGLELSERSLHNMLSG